MKKDKALSVSELMPSRNWPAGKRPDWVDERTRLYTGFMVEVATREWTGILTHFDGKATTAYLTENGFDLRLRGPAVEMVRGTAACHRKVVRKFFRETYGMEVAFDGR